MYMHKYRSQNEFFFYKLTIFKIGDNPDLEIIHLARNAFKG